MRRQRVNHNPRWLVRDRDGCVHLVYACDGLQASVYVEQVLRRVVDYVIADE